MKASARGSAPTSSTATAQPYSRMRSAVRSSSAGRAAMPRSVISNTTGRWRGAATAMSSRSCSGAPSSTSGSTLTKTVRGASRPEATAERSACSRQAVSSSASTPSVRAAANSAAGSSNALPTGPRASDS